MSEESFQGAVIELARLGGWEVAHFHDSRRQVAPDKFVGDTDAAGFPDLVLVRDRVLFVELKTERGRLTLRQRAWLDALARASAEVRLWRPSNWPEIVDTLKRNPSGAVA